VLPDEIFHCHRPTRKPHKLHVSALLNASLLQQLGLSRLASAVHALEHDEGAADRLGFGVPLLLRRGRSRHGTRTGCLSWERRGGRDRSLRVRRVGWRSLRRHQHGQGGWRALRWCCCRARCRGGVLRGGGERGRRSWGRLRRGHCRLVLWRGLQSHCRRCNGRGRGQVVDGRHNSALRGVLINWSSGTCVGSPAERKLRNPSEVLGLQSREGKPNGVAQGKFRSYFWVNWPVTDGICAGMHG
jgi:hypothetical protein